MRGKIAYIVSHGFAARMVMQTNLLGRLAKSGFEVILISPDDQDDNLSRYCMDKGVDLVAFKPASSFWSSNHISSRMYFLENINKNPALLEKYIYARSLSEGSSVKAKIKVRLLKVMHDLKELLPFIKSSFQRREKKMLQSEEAGNLIKRVRPDIIVSTYPVNFWESQLIEAAKGEGVKTVMHLLSWDNISCKGRFPTDAEEYIAWGPIMEAELREYYNVSEDRIYKCGVPHFDLHRESVLNPDHKKYLAEFGLDGEKPYLFFGMSSPRFAPYEIDIVEWLAQSVERNAFGKDVQLIVRPHPQNVQGGMADSSWLPRLKRLASDRTGVDFPKLVESNMPWSMQEKDMVRLSQLLSGALVSFNSGSTLSIDSLMCDTPVILTSFDGEHKLDYWRSARRLVDYVHLKKLVSYKGIPVTNNYQELSQEIKAFLNNNDYLKENRKRTLKSECSNQGMATEVVIKALKKIAANISSSEKENEYVS